MWHSRLNTLQTMKSQWTHLTTKKGNDGDFCSVLTSFYRRKRTDSISLIRFNFRSLTIVNPPHRIRTRLLYVASDIYIRENKFSFACARTHTYIYIYMCVCVCVSLIHGSCFLFIVFPEICIYICVCHLKTPLTEKNQGTLCSLILNYVGLQIIVSRLDSHCAFQILIFSHC